MPAIRGGPPSTKKQQSISNFFSTKSSPSIPQTAPTQDHRSKDTPESTPSGHVEADSYANGNDDRLFISSDEDADPIEAGRCNSSTVKRSLENGGNGSDGMDGEGTVLPDRKRQRVSEEGVGDTRKIGPLDGKDSSEGKENRGRNRTNNGHVSGGGPKRSQLSERTSRYLFSSSPITGEETGEVDDDTKQERERLHQRFVKKLGRPDSIAEIKRRNWHITEETAENEAPAEEGEEEEDEAEVVKPAPKGRKGVASKKGGSKLTPMEKQMLDIKRKHMDTLLVVEVGYKFRFFGEDARIAAKELGIVCIPGKFRYDERQYHQVLLT